MPLLRIAQTGSTMFSCAQARCRRKCRIVWSFCCSQLCIPHKVVNDQSIEDTARGGVDSNCGKCCFGRHLGESHL
jgi:hypothetical protein